MRVVRTTALLFAGFLLACQADAPTNPLQKDMLPAFNASVQHRSNLAAIAQLMAQNNMGNGAFFIDHDPGAGFGIIKDVSFDPVLGFLFRAASFSGAFGPGDFWRVNPDGTGSVHFVTNEAHADYEDRYSGQYYEGSGYLAANFSGPIIVIPGCCTFIISDPSEKAAVIRGHGTVTLNGDPQGVPRTLRMWSKQNPGGQSMLDVSLGK